MIVLSRSSKTNVLHSLAAYASLAVIAVATHFDALAGWWKLDDPQILLFAIRHSPFEALFSPPVWRTLQTVSFAPLQPMSFDLDYIVFGIDPRGFYLHQLLAIVVATLLAYRMLKCWTGSAVAFFTAAAIAASPAMAFVSESLMIRHYLEGVALATGAIIAWQGYRDDSGIARDVVAAALYLLATLAKEVYAPLPLIFIAEGLVRKLPPKRIARRLIPTIVVAAFYLAWRRAMLGTMGGYGEPTSLAAMPAMARAVYGRLYGAAPTIVSVLVAVLAIAALSTGLSRRRGPTLIVLVATGVAAALPLLGVSGLIETRYGFVPIIAMTILIGLAFSLLPPRVAIAGSALLFFLQVPAGSALHRAAHEADAAGIAEGRYVWSAPSSAPPLLASSPAWYLIGLHDLREISGGGSSPRFVFSRHALIAGEVDPASVVRFESGGARPRRLDPATLRSLADERSLGDGSLRLSIDVAIVDYAIVWRLGPADQSEFTWLSVPNYDQYPIPATGSRRVPEPMEPQRFRILRVLPDGRWTMSPVLDVPANGNRVTWSTEESRR